MWTCSRTGGLGPIQADRAHREHPRLLGEQKHLHEQRRSGKKVARKAATVAWSGWRLPAMERNCTDSYVDTSPARSCAN